MNSYDNKLKKNDLEFVETNDFEPHVETNILIREEAEFLARNLRADAINELDEALEHDVMPTLLNVNDLNKENSLKISKMDDELKESFDDLKYTIEKALPGKEAFSSFQDSMNDTIRKLNEIADLLKFSQTEKNNAQNQQNNQANYSNQINNDYLNNQFMYQNSMSNEEAEKELFDSFEKLLDLKMEDANLKIDDMVDELNDTKKKFNKLLSTYEETLKNVSDRQENLNSYLFDSHTTIDLLVKDVNSTKENYQRIEDELAKVYTTWTENNQLLNKLETLMYDVGTAKLGYEDDLNQLLDELKNKTIQNQSSLNLLNIEVENIRDKIETINKNHESLLNSHEENVEILKENIRENEQSILALQEKEFATIERIVGIEQQVAKNTQDIEDISIKLEEVSQLDRTLDYVLSSSIFQKSLEMKISNMITENNNYLGDEFKGKLDNFSTNVISDIDDVRKNNEELIATYQNVENKLLEISNAINSMDNSAEIQSQLEYIEKNYQELYEKTADRIKENLTLIDTQLQGLKVDEREVVNLINSSHELSTIIKDKTRQVVDEKVNDVRHEIELIQVNLENRIKDFNERMLSRVVNEKIEMETSKIKNESLNIIYNELVSRDKKIDLNSEELVKNYETILECNRILDNLEELVIKQGEELDGYKFDRNNSIAILADKISDQKRKLSELEETVRTNISQFDFYENSESSTSLKRGLEAWKLEFSADMVDMVKNLVSEEIKKKNIVSIVNENLDDNEKQMENENEKNVVDELIPFDYPVDEEKDIETKKENDFFVNRVKDILSRLENSDLQKTFEERFNLNVNISDLEKENPEIQSDDLNWFYENEYNEFVSKKKKDE